MNVWTWRGRGCGPAGSTQNPPAGGRAGRASVSLLAAVEIEFDIEIGEAQERGLVTVAALVRLLEAQPALAT